MNRSKNVCKTGPALVVTMTCDVHHVPGRIRFKIPGLRNDETLMRALPRALKAYEGVGRVDVRPESNSLIVHYDPGRVDCRELARSVNKGLAAGVPTPSVSRSASDMRVAALRNRGVRAEELVLGSVREMGIVFGRTAFKVALEQAVRGGLDSLFRVRYSRG
jgi:hypothetical protein